MDGGLATVYRPLPPGFVRRPGIASTRIGRRAGRAAQAVGTYLVVSGLASPLLALSRFYSTPLGGYELPFDTVAGLLLIAISFRLATGGRLTWWFALVGLALAIAIGGLSPSPLALVGAVASAALAGYLYSHRRAFDRPPSTGLGSLQLTVVVAGLLLVLYGMAGIRLLGDEFSPGVRTWSEAFYFTVATVTTVGTGDIIPRTDVARLFTASLILLGVGTFLSGIAVTVPYLEGRIRSVAENLRLAQMQDLEDHVLVCGTSPEVRPLIDALRGQGIRCLILSNHADALAELHADGYPTHVGDASSESVLRAVGAERARAIVAAQDSDAENLLTVITARSIEARVRIVALAKSASSAPKLERAGADQVVSLVAVGGRLLADAAVGRVSTEPRP
jgi:voltage-gated potassium channel